MKWILLCVLALAATVAKAEYVDLKQGGMIVAQPIRCDEGVHQIACVLVDYQDKHYLVKVDAKGEYKIYLIKKGEPQLIWSRDAF